MARACFSYFAPFLSYCTLSALAALDVLLSVQFLDQLDEEMSFDFTEVSFFFDF